MRMCLFGLHLTALPMRLRALRHTAWRSLGILLAIGLLFWGGLPFDASSEAQEQKTGQTEADCIQILKEDNLSAKLSGRPTLDLDAEEEVSLRLIAGRMSRKDMEPLPGWMRISVLERGNRVKDLAESFYLNYRLFASGPSLYWMIGESTGGTNCCLRYHFFGRAANGFLRYLGVTPGSMGSLGTGSFLCRNGQIYLRDQDIRFLYFHTPQASSRLIFDIYYRLTPLNIIVDNKPFRQEILLELKNVEREIGDLLKKGRSVPVAIIRERKEFGLFSDDLGELLVKKAILNLIAGEENSVWLVLEEDIRQYYQTTRGFSQIRDEIKRILKGRSN